MKAFYILYEDKEGRRWETTIEHWTQPEALTTFESEHPDFKVLECSDKK